MSNLSREQLVGKLLDLSIGEPWDFVSEAGQNQLAGTIVAISDSDSEKDWMLMKVSPFNYQGVSINSVVGVNRYVSSQDVFGEIAKGNNVTLNFMFSVNGREFEQGSILTDLQDESSLSFLIGSIVGVSD